MDAGIKLKGIREKLGLRYRQVEQASTLIAQHHRNQDYVVGLSRLADIENKGVLPSLHRLYSLCAIYRLKVADVLEWYGIAAPAGTSKAVIAKLNTAILRALDSPDVLKRMGALGQTVAGSSVEEFTALIRSDYARWGKVVKAAGIKVD